MTDAHVAQIERVKVFQQEIDLADFDRNISVVHVGSLSSVSGSTTIAEAGGVTSLARGGCSILCACNACENPFRPGAA